MIDIAKFRYAADQCERGRLDEGLIEWRGRTFELPSFEARLDIVKSNGEWLAVGSYRPVIFDGEFVMIDEFEDLMVEQNGSIYWLRLTEIVP